ncbi:MAG: hypothetical protein GX776_02535 [Oxalobacter sp.]|nr:hypothetical protein [Oxalobacter sp.]
MKKSIGSALLKQASGLFRKQPEDAQRPEKSEKPSTFILRLYDTREWLFPKDQNHTVPLM